jgi:hypothetical protein
MDRMENRIRIREKSHFVNINQTKRKNRFERFTCLSCGGADRRRKVSGLTNPMVAASQIVITRKFLNLVAAHIARPNASPNMFI